MKMGMMESMKGLELDLAAALQRLSVPQNAGQALEVLEQAYPLKVDLGDGNTFADLMGCGIAIVEQVDRETGATHSVVLTRENLERLLTVLL